MAKKKKKRYNLAPVRRYLTTIASYVKGEDNLIVFKSDFLKEMDNKSFVRWSQEGDCYAARFSAGGKLRNARLAFDTKGSDGLPAGVEQYVKSNGYKVAVAEYLDGDDNGQVKAVVFVDGKCTYLELNGTNVTKEEVYNTPAVRAAAPKPVAQIEAPEEEVAEEIEDEVVAEVEEAIVEEELIEEEEEVIEEVAEEDDIVEEEIEEEKKG